MSITICGAGSVGLVLGARLARSGESVHFVCRNPDTVRSINREGVHLHDAASREGFRERATAAIATEAGGNRISGPVLLCVRGPQTGAAVATLAGIAPPETPIACVQNGLEGESIAASHFTTVIGVVYRQTCTRTAPNSAVSTGAGRVVLGLYPAGCHPAVRLLADRLDVAGYAVGFRSTSARTNGSSSAST